MLISMISSASKYFVNMLQNKTNLLSVSYSRLGWYSRFHTLQHHNKLTGALQDALLLQHACIHPYRYMYLHLYVSVSGPWIVWDITPFLWDCMQISWDLSQFLWDPALSKMAAPGTAGKSWPLQKKGAEPTVTLGPTGLFQWGNCPLKT